MTVFTPVVIEEVVDYANSAGLSDLLNQEPAGPYMGPLLVDFEGLEGVSSF
ncbi:hypothetical protein J6TS2_51390 [Heyndrickxia sporothermodurans]|nr:hypothetical protein J6TS2_51390 [Heyndrickxia sporothermodurans]